MSGGMRSRARQITVPTIIFTYVILALLLSMIVFAYPRTRQRHHDTFEMVHRFCGWTAVALVWCLVSSSARVNRSQLTRVADHLPHQGLQATWPGAQPSSCARSTVLAGADPHLFYYPPMAASQEGPGRECSALRALRKV